MYQTRDRRVIHEVLEKFASDNHIKNATVSIVGGVDKGSKMVSGPHLPIIDGKIDPYIHTVEKESEVTGFGTIFCDENGTPIFHMHGSAGREGGSSTGCFRAGMIAWLVLEVVVTELIGTGPVRKTIRPQKQIPEIRMIISVICVSEILKTLSAYWFMCTASCCQARNRSAGLGVAIRASDVGTVLVCLRTVFACNGP